MKKLIISLFVLVASGTIKAQCKLIVDRYERLDSLYLIATEPTTVSYSTFKYAARLAIIKSYSERANYHVIYAYIDTDDKICFDENSEMLIFFSDSSFVTGKCSADNEECSRYTGKDYSYTASVGFEISGNDLLAMSTKTISKMWIAGNNYAVILNNDGTTKAKPLANFFINNAPCILNHKPLKE